MDKNYLTTHVLDTYHGHPAANMKIELWTVYKDEGIRLFTANTNDDGRVNDFGLAGNDMRGELELLFHVRDYFVAKGVESPFLNQVPIRFTITDINAHYHVPLLVSPWAYNTYRGS